MSATLVSPRQRQFLRLYRIPRSLSIRKFRLSVSFFRLAYEIVMLAGPQEALAAWLQRWNIEILFRTAKQELGMLSCHSTDENHSYAHFTLLFAAETLLRFLLWQQRKTAGKDDCTHGQVIRILLCIRCQVPRNVGLEKQHSITLDIDTEARYFARLIDKLWPPTLELGWFDPSTNRNNHYLESTA